MITDKPARLGDIKAFKVTAGGVDITAAITLTNIWQDIYTPSWSAQLTVQDTSNIIHTIPLRQGASVSIEIETYFDNKLLDDKKVYNFVLYKISDRVMRKSKHMAYIMHLVSPALLVNQGKRIQKHFSETPSSIVQSIISEHIGGSVSSDSTSDKVDVIIPNWTPFIAAEWLAKVSVSGNAADFVFFMSDNNSFSFKSVESMYSARASGLEYIHRIGDMRYKDGNIPKDSLMAIKGYSIEHYDSILNLAGGYFGSNAVWYDFTKKVWGEKEFSFGSDISADNKFAFEGGYFTNCKKANISYVPKHEKLFGDNKNIYENVDKWSGSRKSSMLKLDQDRLFIQVPGAARYWRHLGKNCQVELSSQEDISDEEFDLYFRGRYLITAIQHIIDDNIYTVNLELIKKRLNKKMESK